MGEIAIKELFIPDAAPYAFELFELHLPSSVFKIMGKLGILTGNKDAIIAKVKLLIPDLLLYYSSRIGFGNICGANADFIVSKFREKYSVSKILIAEWTHQTKYDIRPLIIKNREELFGNGDSTMFTSYHAFPLFNFEDVGLFIAIETTICPAPQFIIGTNPDEIAEFIKNRYLVEKFFITGDITTSWINIVHSRKGGYSRKKTSKSLKKRVRSKSRSHKRRQWTRLRC
jgi:hypothetical protein